MLPNISIPLVDVRDVASLHVLAMTADNVVGKRIIAAPAKASSFIEIAQILKDQGYKGPSTRMAPILYCISWHCLIARQRACLTLI